MPNTFAQSPAVLWRDIALRDISLPGTRLIAPQPARLLALDVAGLQGLLADAAPPETPGAPLDGALILALPHPDGGFARFRIVNSPIMPPELAARYPQIQTYAGQGVDDPAANVRLDLSHLGFHAQVLAPGSRWYIDPLYHLETDYYQSYFAADLAVDPTRTFVESFVLPPGDAAVTHDRGPAAAGRAHGETLRVHRLAQAAAGEYTQFFGGTVADGMAAIVTAVNRVTGIFERDLAIRLVLVANNDQLVFTNPATDPYNPVLDWNQINQTTIDALIGNANYDIGHVFHTSGGGYVSGLMGVPGQKARGNTGLSNPTGDPFWIDYVAHEMGHQYSASHTWNGNRGSCSPGQWIQSRALEPGSASTIMGYAGICGLDDLQSNSDAYFHATSIEQVRNHTTNGAPGDIGGQATGNTPPTVSAPADTTIPARTPFMLTASGSDNDGDALTYNWEQIDVPASQRPLDNPAATSGPIFRSYDSLTSPTRYLPRLSQVLNNNTNAVNNCPALPGGVACHSERLSTASRALTFRVTARDNRVNGGGVAQDDMVVTVHDTGTPFRVTAPNTAVTWTGGSQQTVSWNVAGTAAAPISCANVAILFSGDGGQNFTTTVVAGTPNDGSQPITVPNIDTSTARIMVRCATGVFYDLSDSNFSVEAAPDYVLNITPGLIETCLPVNGGAYQIAVDAVAGFNDNVALSAPTAPGSATFAPASGNAPFSSVLTIAGAPVGVHTFDVVGEAGASQRSASITLDVAQQPAAAQGLTPANGTLGVNTVQTLTWTPQAGGRYRIQIATDPAFSNLVVNANNLATAEYTPSLAADSIYYWRVRTQNRCGQAAWSQISAFRTGSPACGDLLVNGGFEQGDNTGWSASSSAGFTVITEDPARARSGRWLAWLGRVTNNNASVSQTVALPAGAFSAELNYYYEIDASANCIFDNDTATLTLNGTPQAGHSYDLCATEDTGDYLAAGSIDLLAYAGQDVEVGFAATTDAGFAAGSLYIDDVTLDVCQPTGTTAFDYSASPASYGIAWHGGDGVLRLGSAWDADDSFAPGHESATDDGVMPGSIVPGQPFNIDVLVTRTDGSSANAWLAGWFDWNGDGDFADAGERALDQAVAPGNRRLTATAPATIAAGEVAYRVRLYDSAPARSAAGAFGPATLGEVTDGTQTVGGVPTAIALRAQPSGAGPQTVWLPLGLSVLMLGVLQVLWRRRRSA